MPRDLLIKKRAAEATARFKEQIKESVDQLAVEYSEMLKLERNQNFEMNAISEGTVAQVKKF